MKVFWKHRSLLYTLVKRQLSLRYAGMTLGWLWNVLTPLLMLSIYTFIFTFVFKVRWQGMEGTGAFALMIFCGLVPFYAVVEILTHSPSVFHTQSSLIKAVIFPIEILPAVSVITALCQMVIAMCVLVVFFLVAGTLPGAKTLLLPLILVPFFLWGLGFSMFLSLIGVFVRDVVNLVQFVSGFLLFLSPVFYSPDQLPAGCRWVLGINPLTHLIAWIRGTLMPGAPLPLRGLFLVTLSGGIVFVIGFQLLLKYKSEVVDNV